MSFRSSTLDVLLRQATIEDHDEVLKACNATLKESKGDLDAQFVKIIALIKNDRYDDALCVLEESGDKIEAKTLLEHAYVLYKLGRQEEAVKRAHGLSDSRGAKHLEAQASYRREDFLQAAKLYKELGEDKAALDYEANDLRINVEATDAQLEWKRQGDHVRSNKVSRQDLDTFETAYNTACRSVARGELGEAEFLLKRAKELCDRSDDLSEEDKDAELLPIKVQQVYVSTLLGKSEPADGLSQESSLRKISDLSTREIAQNNINARLSRSKNPYLSHRLLKTSPSLEKNDALFEFQKELMSYNRMALELQMSKFGGVAKRTTKALERYPSTASSIQGTLSIANAAGNAQNQLGKLGLQSILPLLERRPNDVGLVITIIHLYILTKNHGSAIMVLETFLKRLMESTAISDQDVRHAPGLIALLVSLYSIQGRKSQVKVELLKATSYWRRKSKHPPALLQAAGLSLLASSTVEDLGEARKIFKDLYAWNEQDRIALAGTVASSAMVKPDESNELAEHLTPITRLASSVDVDHFEQVGIPRIASDSKANPSKTRAAVELPTQTKKRIRKSRLPKNTDHCKKPDPERWLPLRDRSTYRPKGKKGKQKAATLTQGFQVEKAEDSSNNTALDAKAKSTSSIVGGAPKVSKKKKPRK